MKKYQLQFLILILCFCIQRNYPVLSADWNQGITAYKLGDYETAFKEFLPLADRGHALAQFNLGVMYRGGIGIPKNIGLAVKYYALAANQGVARAQYLLGSIYRGGKGVIQNDGIALKWFSLAASQGDIDAQYYLGVMYRRGRLQNFVFAHMWWNIAALSGDRMAAKNRDEVAMRMSLSQIRKAYKLAKECINKGYKNC